VSRSHNARQKAKRQRARDSTEASRPLGTWRRRISALLPILIIAGIFAVVGISGFGGGDGVSKQQALQEVRTVLAGLPQHGRVLGSPQAPLVIVIYADLECPTVGLFAVSYLPKLIDTWVRPGLVRLEYRSLKTDTINEHTFFRQEEATLAAARQNRLWDFALTFLYEQGLEYSGYATPEFLSDIGSQVHGLDRMQWRRDRWDPVLSERVALDLQAAHRSGLRYTPSFVLARTHVKPGVPPLQPRPATLKREVQAWLSGQVTALRRQSSLDTPTLQEADYSDRKELQELSQQP
jgi:protein-disulfide isomerase